jgi:hypothetical protein
VTAELIFLGYPMSTCLIFVNELHRGENKSE